MAINIKADRTSAWRVMQEPPHVLNSSIKEQFNFCKVKWEYQDDRETELKNCKKSRALDFWDHSVPFAPTQVLHVFPQFVSLQKTRAPTGIQNTQSHTVKYCHVQEYHDHNIQHNYRNSEKSGKSIRNTSMCMGKRKVPCCNLLIAFLTWPKAWLYREKPQWFVIIWKYLTCCVKVAMFLPSRWQINDPIEWSSICLIHSRFSYKFALSFWLN